MRKQIEERLSSLQAEFKAGQEILAELETRQSNVRSTLVRISGAMQVLEELLKEDPSVPFGPDTTSDAATAAIA
jgi:predicted nuclease with TOPRIM domain